MTDPTGDGLCKLPVPVEQVEAEKRRGEPATVALKGQDKGGGGFARPNKAEPVAKMTQTPPS